jgi:hypothetical protein
VRFNNSDRIALIEGMRPEDPEGGCMADGTPACLFGRERSSGQDQFWWDAPFGLDPDDDIWEFVTRTVKDELFDKRELLEVKINGKSIDEHHIDKLKNDVWFYKILALFFMIMSLIIFLSSCSAAGDLRMKYNPTEDGITHINVYSKGKTELGRWMSNFTFEPIKIDGKTFASIEAYWYWLGVFDDSLCMTSGNAAKMLGRKLRKKGFEVVPDFQAKVEAAMALKAAARPDMVERLRASDLPLTHYYVMFDKVIEPKANKWVIDFWQSLRS